MIDRPSRSGRGVLVRAALTAALAALLAGAAPAAGSAGPAAAVPDANPASTLILRASLLDGTGAPARRASVRIAGGLIAAVGSLKPAAGETVVDAAGLTLSPGFIDTHSHADDALFDHLDSLAATSQGITTVVVGQDGESPYPLRRFFHRLERHPAAVNIAAYAGHGTIRARVLGDDFRRGATPEEQAEMEADLAKEMEAGALGLSTGLEYDPGIYSTREEVLGLARVAAAAGGRYISHIRSEDRAFWAAIDEIIAIGRQTGIPVQISHTKLAMRSSWGQAGRLLRTLDAARASGVAITGDIYPYLYWQSTLTVLFPKRDFENREAADFALREVAPPDGLLLTQFDPEPSYAGKTLAAIAALRRSDPTTTLIDLIRDSEALRLATGKETQSVIGTSMREDDLERLMAWRFMNFCTDGGLDGAHPRGFGSFPRVLGRYVRQRRILTLPQAIRKMTSLAAANMGFSDRGTVGKGMAADLVLFDPAKVADRATTADPHAVSAGIRKVWVNGEVVYDDGRATGARPGRVLRRVTSSD
jgi:N-acyl-D-amino-acid deacylase